MKKIYPKLNIIVLCLIASAVLIFPVFSALHAEESAPQSEEPVSLPQGFVADKSFYTTADIIRISNARPSSAIEIYWLDNPEAAGNPDPESRPSNVYAVMIGDDGTVNTEAVFLAPGSYVLVNTLEPEHCAGFYLSQCRARSDYLGEIPLSVIPN